jgi:two-component system, OmpR family, phosphate regulon sensor histidine kinase PhoR
MQGVKQIKWLPLLMAITIAGIAAFQLYWLRKTYEREERTLEMRTNMAFRETVTELQVSKLKLDHINFDSVQFATRPEGPPGGPPIRIQLHSDEKMRNMVQVLSRKAKDSLDRKIVFRERADSNRRYKGNYRQRNRLVQFLYDVDSLLDPVTVPEIHAAYKKNLQQQNINVPFRISRIEGESQDEKPAFNAVTMGFKNPVTYYLHLQNTFWYIARRIAAPILLSLFIVGFTTLSFFVLYRNLSRQRRLADIKNEFISNITHELKTPIATVSVAIEAMRSYNAHMTPEKSREYLDISANELQRLSLLVDKVLKLSMFEKKEIELKYEPLDMQQVVSEVNASMRLQFEKNGADVQVRAEGDTTLQADRLHLVSVVFNLLDNALKYSNGTPKIDVAIKGSANKVSLTVSDNGIGIPADYRDKIFDKFFRVPTGNLHNAKGYGLGLSYVAHVVRKHQGTIRVESTEGGGSAFIITLPKNTA